MAVHRFTDRWLQSYVGPNEGRIEFVDALCPSLHLRVSRRTKTFSTMFRLNGKLERRTVGRYPRVTLARAREVTLTILRDAAAGGVVGQSPVRRVMTYAAAVDLYEERHLRPNTRSGARIAAGLRCADMKSLFTRPVDSIAKVDVIAVLDGMMARRKPQAAVNHLRRLKMLFNWLCERDVIVTSPCDRLRPSAKTVERDRVLSDLEIVAVWRASLYLEAPYGEMYRMFFLTGQRRSEVATMEWSEVGEDLWTIPRDKVQKDRSPAVPLGKIA
ncbi:MAG TPA: integrase family protein, partial [Sphingomicrobium sp.]|nr:integrase family protein [Sphingomicrobium sp.]